ncbi:imidazole glycerol phosphate synthase subunit HisF [Clostridium botulinum C str. Eklund]|nr:imidazole glycerol phosphate synthase subunit HisF [Clostridium botulinum C str. Eklund]NEZ48701.1 imidazole glycerol phosphate synthase subunit HisF [Clostridium botulinum]
MKNKRIIPCLDVNKGRVVKGIKFTNLRDVGDPAEIAELYEKEGADEIVLLDISATSEGRETMVDVVKNVASRISIPITVGGGIRTIEDFEKVIKVGASKVSINSAAVKTPSLIKKISDKFGKESLVVAIDARRNEEDDGWIVVISGGEIDTGLDVFEWAKKVEELGAGEILLTSKDADGTKDGYDVELTDGVCKVVDIPVIASGGCGKLQDFGDIFERTTVSGALAASMFHFGEVTINEVKDYVNLRRKELIDKIDFKKCNGLVPTIIQDFKNGEVLMLGYMNEEAFARTIESGTTWFWSRSRNELWNKGETSGNTQYVKSISIDCDNDTILIKVDQLGNACHKEYRSCFYRNIDCRF